MAEGGFDSLGESQAAFGDRDTHPVGCVEHGGYGLLVERFSGQPGAEEREAEQQEEYWRGPRCLGEREAEAESEQPGEQRAESRRRPSRRRGYEQRQHQAERLAADDDDGDGAA